MNCLQGHLPPHHCFTGLVDWAALLPQLYTRFMWAFEVPVGAAAGSPPFCECAAFVFTVF